MLLSRLVLQNFRSYEQAVFDFGEKTSVIIGRNTAGKSNLIESIYLLSSGKSFRAEKDEQMVKFTKDIARVKASIIPQGQDPVTLEVLMVKREGDAGYSKRFHVNDVPKRRIDFAGKLKALLFVPNDLDIISGSPSLRRNFLDDVLEQTDYTYRHAVLTYTKALRQRNALLELVRETGNRPERQFAYWDSLLLEHGAYITSQRDAFLRYVNEQEKQLFGFTVAYDSSVISRERLQQYAAAEVGAAATLVGPHRDDFIVYLDTEKEKNIKLYGSRGQQRLVVVQLKLLQLAFMHDRLHERPLLLLDDIFSELDDRHIAHVLDIATRQQTIITTTHASFIADGSSRPTYVINLGLSGD